MIYANVINDYKNVKFTRTDFEEVQVHQPHIDTHFFTEPIPAQKSFDMTPLAELPAGMHRIIVPEYQSGAFRKLIDYESIFENGIMLFNDDVLESFLVKLKGRILSQSMYAWGALKVGCCRQEATMTFLKRPLG